MNKFDKYREKDIMSAFSIFLPLCFASFYASKSLYFELPRSGRHQDQLPTPFPQPTHLVLLPNMFTALGSLTLHVFNRPGTLTFHMMLFIAALCLKLPSVSENSNSEITSVPPSVGQRKKQTDRR